MGASRRKFFAAGCAVTAATTLLGGASNLAAATQSDEDDEHPPCPPIFVVPSPEALAVIESALRDTLEEEIGKSFEEVKASLEQFQRRLLHGLARPDFFLGVGPDFFKSPDGETVLASLERLLALIEGTVRGRSQEGNDTDLIMLSDCDKAFIQGLAEITVGAIFSGPAGALGGFILGVVGLALAC